MDLILRLISLVTMLTQVKRSGPMLSLALLPMASQVCSGFSPGSATREKLPCIGSSCSPWLQCWEQAQDKGVLKIMIQAYLRIVFISYTILWLLVDCKLDIRVSDTRFFIFSSMIAYYNGKDRDFGIKWIGFVSLLCVY